MAAYRHICRKCKFGTDDSEEYRDHECEVENGNKAPEENAK